MKRSRGVTLVELVVVLTIVALVASLSATLVARVAASQQDNRARLVLAQTADGALVRVADALQAALPNSVRLTAGSNSFWLEWVPVIDAGRYRAATDSTGGSSDPLELENAADTSFDVIGTALGTLASGSQLVIQNLGTPDADAYAGSNRRSGLVLGSGGRSLSFTAAGALPQATDTRRFFIVATPMTLIVRGSEIPANLEPDLRAPLATTSSLPASTVKTVRRRSLSPASRRLRTIA
jgi:MSHA biogenesis protein MshO